MQKLLKSLIDDNYNLQKNLTKYSQDYQNDGGLMKLYYMTNIKKNHNITLQSNNPTFEFLFGDISQPDQNKIHILTPRKIFFVYSKMKFFIKIFLLNLSLNLFKKIFFV